jgi:hypothetical protein
MDGTSLIAAALRRAGAAARQAWAPSLGAGGTTEYLYVPCVRTGGQGGPAGTRRWVQPVPIVKKTATLIFYTSDTWDRSQAVVSPGCIRYEQVETGSAGQLFFATRQAAEDYLSRQAGEPAWPAAPASATVRQLRRAMADAHPDHGGTAEQFIQAHRRYQTALRSVRV